jgi:hypothetical protein
VQDISGLAALNTLDYLEVRDNGITTGVDALVTLVIRDNHQSKG